MLHLAQVRKNTTSNSLDLQLLAYQKPNQLWSICHPESINLKDHQFLNEGILVLVELNENREIVNIKEAKEWILNIINNYLGPTQITIEVLEEEKIKIEEWKRELTIKSQELTEMHLGIESRLEQLKELERHLRQMPNS